MDDETVGTEGTPRRPRSRTFGLNVERQLALAAATVLFLACGGDGLTSSDPTGPDANDTVGPPPLDLALPVPAAALLEGAIGEPVRRCKKLSRLGPNWGTRASISYRPRAPRSTQSAMA